MNQSALTQKINSYFAILIITIFGAFAALCIIRIANADAPVFALSGPTGV